MNDNYFEEIGLYLSHIQNIDVLFQKWGYQPTMVPMLDAYAPYENLQIPHIAQSYKVLDANADLLLLRADSTLFLARTISKHLQKEFLPLRLSYSNSVIRPTKEVNNNEIQQNGIELFGVSSISGDFEILLLIYTALASIMKNNFFVHIGSRKLIYECITHQKQNVSSEEVQDIFSAVSERDVLMLSKILSPKAAEILLNILETDEFFEKLPAIKKIFPEQSIILSQYILFIKALSQVIETKNIRCDFSEIGNRDFYTDIVFSVYIKDQPTAVAQGGRYDSLMTHFGLSVSAVGATVFPHVLMPYLKSISKPQNKNSSYHASNNFSSLSSTNTPSIEELVACAKKQMGAL